MAEDAAAETVPAVEEAPKAPEELGDYWPGLVLGINATWGTVWWLVSWFVFVKNAPEDSQLQSRTSQDVLPIGFFWDRFTEDGGNFVYLALSQLTTFAGFLIISVIEFIAWLFYLGGDGEFYSVWVNIVGYWGSITIYLLPAVFSVLQIGITLEGHVNASPGNYCVYLTVVGLAMWLLNSWLHILYADRLAAHVADKAGGWKEIEYLTRANKPTCSVPKGGMTEEQWQIACDAVARAAEKKAAAEASADAADADSESTW